MSLFSTVFAAVFIKRSQLPQARIYARLEVKIAVPGPLREQ